jgi:hypothetical protein
MKIDIFNDVIPMQYLEMLKQHSKDAGIVKRMTNLTWPSTRDPAITGAARGGRSSGPVGPAGRVVIPRETGRDCPSPAEYHPLTPRRLPP